MSDLFTAAAMDALREALTGIDTKTGKPTEGTSERNREAAMNILGGYMSLGPSIAASTPGIWERVMTAFKNDIAIPMFDAAVKMMDNMVLNGTMKTEIRDQLKKSLEPYKTGSPLIIIAMAFFMVVGYVKSAIGGGMALAEQNVNAAMRPALPGLGDILRAVFLDPGQIGKWKEVARSTGIREDHIDMILKSAYSLLDVETVRSLYYRRGRDKDFAYKRLRELAYTDARIAEMMETWDIIPGPQDIIRFAVREAFDDNQAAALGLDEAFPPAVAEWAAKLGLSDPWPKMFWRAHWELPSPQMGYEMLHRGQITEADLDALLRALDYSPRWHGALKAIAYNVVTRVDARRLYGRGIWDESRLVESYREQGYSPRDAEDLAAWTKLEYAQEDKEVSRAQIEKAYTTGIIERQEAVDMLVRLGWTESRAAWLLDIADFTAAAQERTTTVQTVKDNYLAGVMDSAEARKRLADEEIRPEYVEVLIERWNATLETKRKLPSKTDLDKFLKNGLIEESEYKRELTRLGYSKEMADRYYRLNTKTGGENDQG